MGWAAEVPAVVGSRVVAVAARCPHHRLSSGWSPYRPPPSLQAGSQSCDPAPAPASTVSTAKRAPRRDSGGVCRRCRSAGRHLVVGARPQPLDFREPSTASHLTSWRFSVMGRITPICVDSVCQVPPLFSVLTKTPRSPTPKPMDLHPVATQARTSSGEVRDGGGVVYLLVLSILAQLKTGRVVERTTFFER